MNEQSVFVVATSLVLKALAVGSVIAVCVRAGLHEDYFTWIAIGAAWWVWKAGAWLDGEDW